MTTAGIIIACPVTDEEIEIEWVTGIHPRDKMHHNRDLDPMCLVLSLFTGRNKERHRFHLPLFFAFLALTRGGSEPLQDCNKFYSESFTEDQNIDYYFLHSVSMIRYKDNSLYNRIQIPCSKKFFLYWMDVLMLVKPISTFQVKTQDLQGICWAPFSGWWAEPDLEWFVASPLPWVTNT